VEARDVRNSCVAELIAGPPEASGGLAPHGVTLHGQTANKLLNVAVSTVSAASYNSLLLHASEPPGIDVNYQ
jgi:hypothetical protein